MSGLLRGTVYGAVTVVSILTVIAIGVWFERKFAGRMQSRLGPTMVGPIGLFQSVADVVKLIQKEDIVPRDADRRLFDLAPVFAALCALGGAAVVPFSPSIIASDLDVGVLWILAVGGLMVIPTFAAGWASNNKFALLGGMRAVAQSVSYGVPLALAMTVPVILAGSMRVSGIVTFQAEHHWFALWPVIPGLPAFAIFFLAMLAESNRIYMAEYVHTLVGSAVGAALFLGGWDGPVAPGLHWMVAKTLALFVLVYWVRWTLLRFRSDQLMDLCWKWLTPAAVLLVLFAAGWVQFGPGGVP